MKIYPHMCCDGHDIGFSSDPGMCPLCIAQSQLQAADALAKAAYFIEEQLKMLYEGKVLPDDTIMGIGIDPWGSRKDFKDALAAYEKARQTK